LRFPGFEGGWEDNTLGEICKMQAGKFVSASEIYNEWQDGLYHCYGGNGLRGYTKSNNQNGLYSLIGRQGALCGNVTLVDGKFHATEHAVVVTPKNSIDNLMLHHLLKHLNLNQYATGAAQPGLSVQNLEKVEVKIPKAKAEQQKIASFLSLIDEKIQTQNKIIKELNVLKTTAVKKIFSKQLKFKDNEDNDFPEWEIMTLGDLGKFSGGGTPSSSNDSFWSGDIPWISSSDLLEDDIHSINITRYISESAIKNSSTKLCSAPVILIVSRVGVGKIAYSEKAICTSQDFLNIYDFKCNGLFLTYYLSVEMKKAASNSQGTSIKGITSAEIKSKQILLPCIAEQTKIANFLFQIDTKINLENQLLEKIEDQKKYFLHNLFI
jgi:type I restriction enzyme S subunit